MWNTVWESCRRLFVMVFFKCCIDSINAINKMTINYMHKTLINCHFDECRQCESATDNVYFSQKTALINLISFHCARVCSVSFFHWSRSNYNKFLSLFFGTMMVLQTNFVRILCSSSLFFKLHFIFIFILVDDDYMKSEWMCSRARFYCIHCLTVQRAHVIFFILQTKTNPHRYQYIQKNDCCIGFNNIYTYDNDWFALN